MHHINEKIKKNTDSIKSLEHIRRSQVEFIKNDPMTILHCRHQHTYKPCIKKKDSNSNAIFKKQVIFV